MISLLYARDFDSFQNMCKSSSMKYILRQLSIPCFLRLVVCIRLIQATNEDRAQAAFHYLHLNLQN